MLISKSYTQTQQQNINNLSMKMTNHLQQQDKKRSISTSKKEIPAALTVNGTTPSGKPRLYVCNTCTRAFARQEHLKRHERSHTQEKPFVCGVCERLFSRRDLLLRHAQKLHAGCADAITRIRKKSARRKSSTTSIKIKEEDVTFNEDKNPFNFKVEVSNPESLYPDIPSKIMANPVSSVSPPTPLTTTTTSTKDPDNNIKRRASFSAVSSANYSLPIPNTSYAENVEFSTPSLSAVQPSWLNGFELDAIPELNLFNNNNNYQNTENNNDHESPFGTKDQPELNKKLPNISGYSFYENEEETPIVESLFNNHHLFKTPAVNKRNEDYSPADSLRRSSSSGMSLENNIDRNLNEIEEITDLNIPKMYDMPAGYSFYGNVDQQSNSASSNATISPSLLDAAHNNISNISTPPQRIVIQTANTFTSMLNLDKYSRILLFSPILRSHINHTLNNYPFVGVKVPNLPSNDKLNAYTENFIDRFLPHYPFVHKSMLNEYALMKTTLADVSRNDNDMNQIELDNLRASISCLPLLVATIGALLSDEKQDANSLYEVSRRCIHVYLDSRKKKANEQHGHPAGLNSNNASPLWLIQSLTLSVIYGLFADNDVSINVVIRQVNALTALVKSSEMTKVKWDYNSLARGERVIDEDYYYDFIKYESAVRTIHAIFHVVITLTSLYNIAPSLKIDDLELDLPNSSILWNSSNHGEFKSFYNGFAFQPENYKKCLNNLISLEIGSNTNELSRNGGFFFNHHVSDFGLICLQNGLHQLFYYDKLYGNNSSLITRQNSFNSVSSSMKKKDPLKENYLNICKIWNMMINQCKLYSNENDLIIDSKLMNYHLMLKNSAFKSQTRINLKLHKLKEQVWLKDWEKMCDIFKGFEVFNNAGDDNSDDVIEMVSYCLLILKEIFFNNTSSETNITIQEYFNNYDEILQKEVDTFMKTLHHCDLQHLVKISSLHFQILFDVFIVLIKFVLNFDMTKSKVHSDLHSSFSFKNSPIGEDEMDIDIPEENNSSLKKTQAYVSIVKLILSLQYFLQDKFQFNQVNDDYKQQLNNMMLLNDGIKHTELNDDEDDEDGEDDDEIFTGLTSRVKSSTNLIPNQDATNLIPKEKLLGNFFKIIDFIFDYLIFNKFKFKFGCFKNLNCGLIKLNFFLFNDQLLKTKANTTTTNNDTNNTVPTITNNATNFF